VRGASSVFGRVAAFSVRRAPIVLGAIVVLAAGGALAASRLTSDAGTDTLVSKSDSTYKATQDFKQRFGDDAVVVLVKGDLRNIVLTQNLGKLLQLEGCLAGNAPESALTSMPPVCRQISELNPSKVVFGPATFLNQAVVQIQEMLKGQISGAQDQAKTAGERARREAASRGASESEQDAAANQAEAAVIQQFQQQLIQVASQYNLTKAPQIDDPEFVSRVVFDQTKEAGTPKSHFSYLFPNKDSALVSIRMRPDLSESQRADAISLYKKAVENPTFTLDKATYTVSGVPAVVDGLANELRGAIFILLAVAILVMALVLTGVIDPPLRLLPLFVALSACGMTFGVLSLLGGTLTMASIAVLPVLIGLSVDYAIQFQARWNEARGEGKPPAQAASDAAAASGPVIATAVLATVGGVAALLLSPVPMVRTFALLLMLGVALSYAIALTGGLAALSLAARPRPASPGPQASPFARRMGERLALARARGAMRLRAAGVRSLAVGIANPGRVLVAAGALALCGWVAGSQATVTSDIRDLAPPGLPALKAVNTLQDTTGVSGELNVTVHSADITNPDVIRWMRDYQQRVLDRHGYSEGKRCTDADLCPALSLDELLGGQDAEVSDRNARQFLDSLPQYFSQSVISRDPGDGTGGTANIAFGIPVMPLDQQKDLVDDIRAQIDPPGLPGPPAGTDVHVAGLPALAADANGNISSSRYWLPPAALLAVAIVLLAVYRSWRRVLVPLVPIALATGWSSLVVAAMDIPLNPMTATLGALVIAIATEFSVLLSARYEAERAAGLSLGEALRRTYERTGTAVLASGATAIAGFATLAVSDIRMLRDFGLVTIADLAVALAGVVLVLPAVLVWAEGVGRAPADRGLWARLTAPGRA
jgi:hydrophobe/amphiphile efflux-3 (HAE3) family protein